MAVCSRCGEGLNPNERFCAHCGLDTWADTQQTAIQPTAPQAVYVPPAAQTTQSVATGRGSILARAAMGLGIGGGLLGILWGALGPYLSLKASSYVGWFFVGGNVAYPTGIDTVILLIVGLALGVLAILGAIVATRAIWATRVLLIVSGLGGFLLGPSWLLPGALLLAGAGLAIAARSDNR